MNQQLFSSKMSKRPPAWSAIKNKICKKRTARATKDTVPDCLTVQQMSSSVDGKYQKYCRVRSLESVNLFSEGALSIQTIKEACTIHYKEYGKKCDILMGERGP